MLRLRGVAKAALDGRLDADRLRGMPEDAALRDLQRLRGVGPWAASHIYFRGAAPIDALPTAEPRVLHGLASVRGVPSISPEAFAREASAWRPFRMWVSVLLARHLARTPDWRAPTAGRRAPAQRTRPGEARSTRGRAALARARTDHHLTRRRQLVR